VEFYYGRKIDGPFELIGKHYGPEYVIYRNYATGSQHFFKARAVDVYGNFVESAVIHLIRLNDPFPPAWPQISLEGNLKNDRPVAGHPFTVAVQLNDPESGVELALLRRNGLIVAAAFENGVLRYEEPGPQAGETFDYRVTARDQADNYVEITRSYTAVADSLPTIDLLAADSPVREQGRFNVQVQAGDDLGLRRIEVVWNGSTTHKEFSGAGKSEDYTFRIKDLRAVPVEAPLPDQPLTVTVTDSGG